MATAWRYVREAINLLAATADGLNTAMTRIRRLAYAILDGTLIPIDRVADQKPYYSGKHHRHGVNVQVIADPAGRLVWASVALPGSTHDLSAARTHTIINASTSANVMTFADKASSRSCAAAHAAPLRSCRPSSSCTTSKTRPTQDEKGSLADPV
ncbi:hypothetical protein Ahu01nite_078470 [Winogradskya humida]|uniref:DDE Tnp4 domain-containing protein n=1 Tax=Winogradskya humida TaxID=113566 RepID=A0ABQ4A1L5_9ACTN|nr:hypothetical protein Ahu01nite_078470 [Actinoplanes humidus]